MKKISVVIPVYNGRVAFEKLIESLSYSYEMPSVNLHFFVQDDGSTDPALHEFYNHPFFQRSDVSLTRRAQNLGFIRTVNEGISLTPKDSDLVILNSDTQVWTRAFEKLQEVSLRFSRVGSLTPLTNNGTIASLFRWPNGMDLDGDLSPKEVAEVVHQSAVQTPCAPAPTGVGFCMYIPRFAWELVGGLAEEYGKGYGEECDWSQRAIRSGFQHLICTEAYVHHSGTASFTSDQKKALIEKNSILLEQRNPGYHRDVGKYVNARPLKTEISFLLTALIRAHLEKNRASAKVILMMFHKDPFLPEGGGTEKHGLRLIESIQSTYPVLTLYRLPSASFGIQLNYQGAVLFRESFHLDSFPDLLVNLAPFIQVLHIHHWSGFTDYHVDFVLNLPFEKKIFTVHDYYSICPSINLLRDKKDFCAVEADLTKCNQCLHQAHGVWDMRIEQYRNGTAKFLAQFDDILFPSAVIEPYFQKAFAAEYPDLCKKMKVIEHNLTYIQNLTENQNQIESKPLLADSHRFVFLGHLSTHKGSEIVADALDSLIEKGFKPEIWGSYYGSRKRKVLKQVPIFPFQSTSDLKKLFDERKPYFVVIPSIWAETFSYVFYEVLMLGGVPLIVGPWGNPAFWVKEKKLGVVMKEVSGNALVQACIQLKLNQSEYRENVLRYVQTLKQMDSFYPEGYCKLIQERNREGLKKKSFQGLRVLNLSCLDFHAQENEIYWLKIAKQINRILEKVPRVNQLLLQLAKQTLIVFRKVRHTFKMLQET